MTTALLIALALLALAYAVQRSRARNLDLLNCDLRDQNATLQKVIDEHLETTELMLEHCTALERRNVWLESKRYLILRRWWWRRQRTEGMFYRASWRLGRML